MSAPSKSSTSPPPCACTNISLIQLFHELKQKFPGVPDQTVSDTIELYCHNKEACETQLHKVKATLPHAYHASSSAAAKQLKELKFNVPLKCPNQPIVKYETESPILAETVLSKQPQSAVLSNCITENKINTDANQNVVDNKPEDIFNTNIPTPTAVVNIESCYALPAAESPSDLELSNENLKEEENKESENAHNEKEAKSYGIHKSSKVKCDLNVKLEKGKETKLKKEECVQQELEKPKRPNTLDFIRPNPDIAFTQTLKKTDVTSRSISPAQSKETEQKDTYTDTGRAEQNYPLNLSVNVNCLMDYGTYGEPWLEDFDSPRAITSVNLTVCTPTSNMASPIHEKRDDSGFEGLVTVTVSPSLSRPRRQAPPPPSSHLSAKSSPIPTRVAPPPPSRTAPHDNSLIERQKERLACMAEKLAQERESLSWLTRETQILAAPPPSPAASHRLREYVSRLRDQCDGLVKRSQMCGNEPEGSDFYSNIYAGQRPSASWQCHMCTFRNHPFLDKCEECDMPRIEVVRAPDGITVRLMPGRRKFVRSWVL